MAVAAFQSDREALEFLYGGPVADPQLDVAPENPEALPVNAVQAPLPGAVEPNVQAVLDERGEPPLPPFDEAEDAPLPPVMQPGAGSGEQGAAFASDEEALAFLRTADAAETAAATGQAFASDEDAVAFLKGAEATSQEIKLPPPNPVTTPEAADGTDVTFEKDGPAFQFTGSLVVDPTSGPEQGLDGMVPAPARGPVATMPGAAEPVMNRRPRLVPSEGGQIVFDQSSPERFTQGVEEAFAAGILPQANYEKIKAASADIFKVVEDRRKLEEKAQQDPKLLAVLQGLGRGGAMTAGAVGGAKVGAAGGAAVAGATGVGAPLIPVAAAVGGTAGAIVGGIGAGLGYDALYKKLAEHFEEYDNVMKAAELYPMHRTGGELTMAALALPVSVAQGARGLQTAYQAGGLPQVARTAGTAAGLGAGTGVVAYPIDAAVRGEEITPGGFAAAAGTGALMGGFFINNRMANAQDVAAVAAKMKAGQALTAAETQLARAAQPQITAAIARMEAAGGVRTGPLDVEVPVTSVAGLVPSAGRARVDLPFSVPARLPAGAVRAAQARAEAGQRTTGPAVPTGETAAPVVPREAPVNVLPTGPDVIPMPGPAAVVPRAMLTPDAFVDAMAAERGLDMDFNPTATEELFAEHFELVKAAVNNNEPVSAAALDLYEMRVPYYVRNEETGVASYDEAAFRAYEDYLTGRDREFRQEMTESGGVELLDAVIELGGLPSRRAAGSRRSAWAGELESLLQTAQGAGKGKGSDNQKGVFMNKLFRRDGKDLDDIVTGLQQKGFRVSTPQELIEMLDMRLRTGNEVFGVPTQSMEDVPLEMRGARRTAGPAVPTGETPAPRVEDIKQAVTAVHAQAVAQSEGFLRDVTDAAAQSGGRAVQEMFPKAVKALDRAVTKVERSPKVPSDLLRATVEAPAGGPAAAEATANQLIQAMAAKGYQIYAPGGKPDITDRHLDAAPGYKDIALKFVKDADGPDPIVKEILVIQPAMLAAKKAIHGFYKQVREIDRQLKNETRPEVIAMLKQASAQAEAQMLQLAAQAYEADLAGVPANQARRLAIQASASVQSSADISSTSSGKSGGVGMPLSSTERGLAFMSSLSMQQQGSTPGRGRQAAPGSVSSDPLTPPASVRSGGPAKVPPGTPVGMAAINPPDWVLAPGETSAGRRIIKGIQNFRPGQRWGFRSIVDFVNEAVRLEMRRSTSQTTRTHPAHYKPAHHMAYTRETQSQINFHEAGHGLEYLIRARVPDFFNAYADELLALANRPGSMASDAPTALSAEAQRQYRIGEGVAEWTRLLMVDPAAVQNLKVTAALAEVAERFYPGMAKSLRDGARAVNAFQAADVATRWAMFNAVPGANPGANELIGAIVRGGESAVNMIASGAPVSALDRKITRAIIKQRKETETAYGAAVKKARETRATNLTPLMSAYNMILSIGAETQLAISGQSISKGLRIVEDDGSFRYLTHETWRDLRKKVPASKLAQFDQAAWAKESLNRYENGGLEYPGMREGISPADLKAIVAAAEREIPNFTALYKEQSRFHDLILEVKEAGGLISPEDRAKMQSARDGYWPLPRVMTAGRGRGGRGRGDISAGVFRARGSGEAIRNIDEVTEERTREMFEAYYWNRFGTKLYDNMLAVAKDKSLPAEARKIAGSTMVKLKMPMQSAAKVSKEEALGWVMKAIGDAYERALGFRPEVKAEDINLSWSFRDVWRPVKPTDVNVVSLLRDGKREYYQIGDPAMFALFSRPQEARAAGKFVSWAVGPMTENWKRNITQGLVFAVRNMFRDVFTQPMMNPDPVGWVPGWSHWKGAVNKWTQKYPQVFSEGLLLSRVEPSSSEMVNSVKHGAVWQWLTEGFYVSQAKDPIVRTLATVLNPSNFLFPLWKTVDLINLVTGGRTLAQFMETAGREGAAVAALERGATDEEALAKYWTAAGQFNEHAGNADARIMMRIPGFLNPMLQGLRNQVQKLTDPDPAVAGTTWLRLLAMMPVAFGGAAIVRYLLMDEQEKEKERQRPVDERMNFMDLGGFSIPFPFGVEGVMGSVIYNAAMDDLLSRPKVDADRTALMLLKRIADPGSALQFFGPQLATLQEANMNWSSFRQKHIVAPWMVNLPASEQYYSTTPEFYRKLGQMMNYSPAKLQYIVQQAISRQADETIRLAESLDRGRPIMEAADVPFVGRMFVRDPIGFGSQAVRSAAAVEDKLRLLDERLKSKGWHSLKDPEFPADKVGSVELRKLQVQLAYLEDLRKGLRVLSDMQGVGKYYTLARDYANERNVRTLQTQYTQSLLIGNRDRLAVLEQALDLVKQIPQAPPEQVAAEYLNRRF